MPRRGATVTQADVARTIRAMVAAGLKITRCVTRPDGVSIETTEEIEPPETEQKKPVVL
jgi:hypothetical protein